MGDLHRAPRQKVLAVRHVGGYGSTQWVISLECGHTEKRKRAPKTDHVGCRTCVQDERLLIDVLRMPSETPTAVVNPDNQVVLDAARLAARIASLLKVTLEMVDVRISAGDQGLEIQGASVWIPKESLSEIS